MKANIYRLYIGLSVGNGDMVINNAENTVRRHVEGYLEAYTLYTGHGAFNNGQFKTIHEPCLIIEVIYPEDDGDMLDRLKRMQAHLKATLMQEAIILTEQEVIVHE